MSRHDEVDEVRTTPRAAASRQPLRAQVVRRVRRSPHLATVTIGGPGLVDFRARGGDQWVRLVFRRDGQSRLRMPTWSGTGALLQLLTMDLATRPWVRSYTVRAFRADALELDLDVVVHGDASPGSRFGTSAQPGDEVALLDEGATYRPAAGSDQVLVADDSAVPAALAILESTPDDVRTVAVLEVADAADVQELGEHPGLDARWVHGRERHRVPGQLALRTLGALELPPQPRVWIAGESGLVKGARRLLVAERGIPRSAITFTGYWRHGRSAAG